MTAFATMPLHLVICLFGAPERLYFVIVAFPGSSINDFIYFVFVIPEDGLLPKLLIWYVVIKVNE